MERIEPRQSTRGRFEADFHSTIPYGGVPGHSRDSFALVPLITLPLLFAGPWGIAAYFAINLAAGCGGDPDLSPIDRGHVGVDYDIVDDNEVDDDAISDDDYVDDDLADDDSIDDDADDDGAIGDDDESPDDDSIDDDDVDDDVFAPECAPGDFRPCGPCDLGIQACGDDGLWEAACEGITSSVLAEARDCYSFSAATRGVGECSDGSMRCEYDGSTGIWRWGSCRDEAGPSAEVCDGLDNDCDGRTDEGVLNSCGDCGPAPAEICRDGLDNDCDGETDEGCPPSPTVCTVTDRFEFGDMFDHEFETSGAGVHIPGDDDPYHSCGAAHGIFFGWIGDWAKVRLAVDPLSTHILVNAWSRRGGVQIQADGFECSGYYSPCWIGGGCTPDISLWRLGDELPYNIFSDGHVDIVIDAAIGAGTYTEGDPYRTADNPDIAIIEIESCGLVE